MNYIHEQYIDPAKLLISENSDGSLFAAALLLLCALDELSIVDADATSSNVDHFVALWKKLFGSSDQISPDGRFEYFPVGTDIERAAKIVWSIYRCRLAHSGGKIRDRNALQALGDWQARYDRFVVVNRQNDIPAFCLNQPDSNGEVKITLDAGKLVAGIERHLRSLQSVATRNIATDVVEVSTGSGSG